MSGRIAYVLLPMLVLPATGARAEDVAKPAGVSWSTSSATTFVYDGKGGYPCGSSYFFHDTFAQARAEIAPGTKLSVTALPMSEPISADTCDTYFFAGLAAIDVSNLNISGGKLLPTFNGTPLGLPTEAFRWTHFFTDSPAANFYGGRVMYRLGNTVSVFGEVSEQRPPHQDWGPAAQAVGLDAGDVAGFNVAARLAFVGEHEKRTALTAARSFDLGAGTTLDLGGDVIWRNFDNNTDTFIAEGMGRLWVPLDTGWKADVYGAVSTKQGRGDSTLFIAGGGLTYMTKDFGDFRFGSACKDDIAADRPVECVVSFGHSIRLGN